MVVNKYHRINKADRKRLFNLERKAEQIEHYKWKVEYDSKCRESAHKRHIATHNQVLLELQRDKLSL